MKKMACPEDGTLIVHKDVDINFDSETFLNKKRYFFDIKNYIRFAAFLSALFKNIWEKPIDAVFQNH